MISNLSSQLNLLSQSPARTSVRPSTVSMPHSRPKLQRLVTSVLGRQAQATRVSLASPPAISSLQRGKVIEANQPRNASRNFKREHVVI